MEVLLLALEIQDCLPQSADASDKLSQF